MNLEEAEINIHEKNITRHHKIPVPTQYRQSAKILKQIVEDGKSFKELVYNNKHIKTGSTVALLTKLQANQLQLDYILSKTEILQNIKNTFLAKILVTELIFGNKKLIGYSKPVECVLQNEQALKTALEEFENNDGEGAKTIPKQLPTQYRVPRYVRINTLLLKKTEAKEYLEREGWKCIDTEFETYDMFIDAVNNLDDESYMKDFHIKNLLVFPTSSRKYWATNHLVQEGKFLLHDKASCLPSYLLNPSPKSIVLDMCAAPGNKTTHLAAIMKNKGKIYAAEMNTKRYETLVHAVSVTNASIVQPINMDVLALRNEEVPKVEYILLDPSCSGSGMLNRFEYENSEKDSSRLYRLAGLQYKLLVHALTEFPHLKKCVYSTCSLHPEENEEVILSVLKRVGNFKLSNIEEQLNSFWKNFGNEKVYPEIGKNCIYARTEDDLTNGFFVCVLERCEEGENNQFFNAKQENLEKNKFKTKKRTNADDDNNVDGDVNPEIEATSVKKKKKKWISKGYNQ